MVQYLYLQDKDEWISVAQYKRRMAQKMIEIEKAKAAKGETSKYFPTSTESQQSDVKGFVTPSEYLSLNYH